MAGSAPLDCHRAEEEVIMRRRMLMLAVVLLAATVVLAHKNENVDQLKQRAEKAKPEDQPPLFAEIAEQEADAADKKYADGDSAAAAAALAEVVKYSEAARDASVKTGKHLKKTEIAMRKIVSHLGEMKHAATVEDQPTIQDAIDRLEKVRTDLLNRMFSPKADK
jgi:hypothetical protein